MTEYEICGLVFFGYIATTLLLYSAFAGVEIAIKKRKIKRLKRTERRMRQTAEYAEFVAISEVYK